MTNPARSDDPSSAASPGYIFGVSEPAVGRDPGVVPSAAMRVRPSAVAACSISASTTRPAQSCGPPRRCAAADPAAMDAARI